VGPPLPVVVLVVGPAPMLLVVALVVGPPLPVVVLVVGPTPTLLVVALVVLGGELVVLFVGAGSSVSELQPTSAIGTSSIAKHDPPDLVL